MLLPAPPPHSTTSAQVDPVDDTDLTHINLLKYEPEHEQKVIVEIPFNVVNHDKSPGTRPFQ